MPVYNDLDDSDAWHDDTESMASTDISSHAEDSDYEFLTRTSSHAGTEEDIGEDETDSGEDELPSIYTTTQSASASVASLPDAATPPEDGLADSVLQSTELPYVMPRGPDSVAMDDSTATVVRESSAQRERQDTVTPASVSPKPAPAEPIASKGAPFTILWSGSATMKSDVLRKLAQALMTALLREQESASSPSSTATDWSSGYTSVVPITEFHPSSTAPEVEFVEDSLVKLRIRDLDMLQTIPTMRATRFVVELDNKTQVMSCCHTRTGAKRPRTGCPWWELAQVTPSLIVYASPSRGEKFDGNQRRIELFAKVHRVPILVISDMNVHRFGRGTGEFSASEVFPLAGFFDLDSLQLGRALWKNAKESKEAIKVSQEVHSSHSGLSLMMQKDREFKMNFHKRMFLRLVFMALVLAAVMFFRLPGTAKHAPVVSPSVSTEFGTSEMMPPPTVTVTEQLTIKVPVTVRTIHTETKTKTVTSAPTAKSAKRPTSTVTLHAITRTVNVPKACLKPRAPEVDYGYAFGYDDNAIQLFLETEHSLLLRLPKVYREHTALRPPVRIAVMRDQKPVEFELREWKKNDLAFITWSEEEMHGRLDIRVWTEGTPVLAEHVVVDYAEPIIDPRLWEMLSKSQDAAVKRLVQIGEEWDSRIRAVAKDVRSRVSDQSNYAAVDEKWTEGKKQMAKYHQDAQQAAKRQFEGVKGYMVDLWAAKQPILQEEWTKWGEMREKVKAEVKRSVKQAHKGAVLVSEKVKKRFEKMEPVKMESKKPGKRGCTKCGKGGRRR
jgi:hypothetical protein